MYKLTIGSIQHKFQESRNKIQFFGGGFANGKTTALVIKALRLAHDYPGSNGLLGRSTYPKLNDTLRKVFFAWCPENWIKKRPTQDDNTCYLTNGTVINFRYISQRGKQNVDGSTTSNLLSATYDWIGIDQVEDPEIVHKDMLDLMGRLRGQTPYRPDGPNDETMPSTGPRWLMLTSNPSPGWVYKEMIQPVHIWKKTGRITDKLLMDKQTGLPIIDIIEGSTYTNASNLTPDFINSLEVAYKGQMGERFLQGKWAAFEGLVYGDFAEDRNVITREQALEHIEQCRRRHVKLIGIEGYDFGLTSPSCYLMGVVDDWGRVIILDGYHKRNFHYSEQPDEYRRIRNKYVHLVNYEDRVRADPSIFRQKVVDRHKNTGDTIAKLLKDMGMPCRPANNDITSGVAKVGSYIAGTPWVPHIVTKERPGPLLYVVDDLQFVLDEIGNYYWDKDTFGGEIDQPIDRNDHAMDTMKYMLSHLPDAANIEVPHAERRKPYEFWREEEDDAEDQYARF